MSSTKEKLQSIRISPVSLHAFTNLKEQYFKSIQSTSWPFENDESDSYDKNDAKEKVKDLVRLRKAMQAKLKTASYSERIQILTLVPDKWMDCSEYFNVFEYLVWASHEIKTVGGILAKPASEKGKNYLYWNTSSGNKRLWRWQFQ